jgi:hypothetical protein
MDEAKYLFKELDKEDLYSEDMLKGFRSWRVIHNDEGGWTENDVQFYLYKDGSITMSEQRSESATYLYPDQVEHLIQALKSFGALK